MGYILQTHLMVHKFVISLTVTGCALLSRCICLVGLLSMMMVMIALSRCLVMGVGLIK